MERETERRIARLYLAQRECGYSGAAFVRAAKWGYVILGACLVLVAIIFSATDELWAKGLCLWAAGMLLGAVLRDVGWFRRIKMNWPFTEKIIDWQKVEEIASEDASPEDQGP